MTAVSAPGARLSATAGTRHFPDAVAHATGGPQRPLDERCSFAAARRDDDLAGTAPPTTRFLLVEQPGPWGRIAIEQSSFDPEAGLALAKACGASGTRPLLIRRPGRAASTGGKRWFLADTTPQGPSLRTGLLEADAELIDVLAAACAGEPVGDIVTDPLYAVCTHGKHDACCAIRGRPVAQEFARLAGDAAWEVSHLGGDRFAGNLLVLPWGLYYGRVRPGDAAAVLAATGSGRVLPDFYRGCAAFATPGQAAQAFARARSGRTGIYDHQPRSLRQLAKDQFEVTVDPAGGPGEAADRWRLVLERRPAGSPQLLTCSAVAKVSPPYWAVVELQTP